MNGSRVCKSINLGSYSLPKLNAKFELFLGFTTEDDSSSFSYAGCAPYSESETRSIRDFMTSIKGKLVAYLGLHSYGQVVAFPWAYTKEKKIPQYDVYVSQYNGVETLNSHS